MMKIVKCNREEYPVLTGIWERSVRATHDFLTEDVISDIKRVLASDYSRRSNCMVPSRTMAAREDS